MRKTSSDESARYGLELFRRLNLQLLIVTPLQKIHVIEDYVNSVHFVHNQGGNHSMLPNLTIEQYRQEKQQEQERLLQKTMGQNQAQAIARSLSENRLPYCGGSKLV